MTTLIPAGSALIGPDQYFAQVAVLGCLIALGLLVGRTRAGQYLTGVSVVMLGGVAVSNTGLVPFQAPLWDGIMVYLVPLAIPLLLFKADLRRVLTEAGPVTLLFLLGALFSVLGALLAAALLDAGPEEGKVLGTFAATYIGGSMNLVAVSNALGFTDLGTVSGALAADNIIGTTYLVSISILSGLKVFAVSGASTDMDVASPIVHAPLAPGGDVADTTMISHLAIALGASALICALAVAIAGRLGVPGYSVLLITLLAVGAANLLPRQLKSLRGEFELGTLFMYVFFAVIGISTDIGILLQHSLVLAGFAAVTIVVHLALLLPVARLLGYSLADTLIASNACIAGPATAAAMAASRGWTHLVVPAVMVGVLGYVIANFIGVSLARLYQAGLLDVFLK
ncbi:DUF819 family protein [Kineobactrum salinum]|uniref:DUF819 family protein n=1 Tax=Kineobactrum salinum TaxID=2708301 RepID=A0A6C0U511_9GAMM|nr:DUF819 family protein [Kineobactrum salinum]QIB64534.1 DUF819 family protein [Kineobactrum salinum]